jgi:hypothetical protein
MPLERFRHRRLNHGDAKRTSCGVNRQPIQKRLHDQKKIGWSFGLVGSAPGTGKNPEILRDTLQRLPVGSVDWCDSLPTGLIFNCRGAPLTRHRRIASSFLHNNIFSPISQEEKLKSCRRRTPQKPGAVLQNFWLLSNHPLLTHISVQQHSCNKKAP